MADLPEEGPSEALYTNTSRRRRASYASQTSVNSQSVRRRNQLRTQASTTSIRSVAESETDQSEIHSPMPRRHLLLQTESQPQWLRAASISPAHSSRPNSPLTKLQSGAINSQPFGRPIREHSLSFSSLMELEHSISPISARRHLPKASDANGSDDGAGKRWLRWMHRHNLRGWILPCAIAASTWIKWCTGLGGYSGANVPPMFGDYEAQRHWMELTLHLPIQQWYTYDLQYWGLDYPPLTAYHSLTFGAIGARLNPTWFALDKSRGLETPESKVFMRTTVLLSDLLIYVPSLLLFLRTWHGSRSRRTQNLALLTLLLQPSLVLIDSGHFQYNSVMLGLTLLALDFFAAGQDLFGAVCFVMSLGFKQMALYYAPAIGSYLLGKCLHTSYISGARLFVRLALTTVVSFYVLFIPFLPPFAPLSAIGAPITRIFPFSRGLFEDKVANFWCASNVAFKWKMWATPGLLIKLSAVFTVLGFLPAVVGLVWGGIRAREHSSAEQGKPTGAVASPTLPLLPYALLTSSMSFFLFSFQVHEKTILLPLLPLTLLLSGASHGSPAFEWGMLTNNVAIFSMWPLLKKDGLGIQYVALTFLWNWVIGHNPFHLQLPQSFVQLLSLGVYPAILSVHLLELLVAPPPRYPDLFPVLNVLISTPVFILTWLWSIKRGLEISWALGGLGPRLGDSKREKYTHVAGSNHIGVVDRGSSHSFD